MSTSQKKQRVFHWQKDKKIHAATIQQGVVPVYVREAREESKTTPVWFVWPAMQMPVVITETLNMLLRTHANEEVESYWLFHDVRVLERITQPHDGVTPEYVYRVEEYPRESSSHLALDDDTTTLQGDVTEEFVKMIVERTRIADLPTMKLMWNVICQVIAHWLLKERKPINLGLFTLCAIPYRANWKSVLYAAFPQSHYCFTKTESDVEHRLNALGVSDALMGTEVLEINAPNHWAGWTLEVIPHKVWEDAVQKMEAFRLHETGLEQYATYLARTIRRLRPFIISAYRNFICRSVKPAARVSKVGGGDWQILVPNTPKGGIRPRIHHGRAGDIVINSSVDWEKPEFRNLLEEKIDEVLELSGPKQKISQLRITGGHVGESEHGED